MFSLTHPPTVAISEAPRGPHIFWAGIVNPHSWPHQHCLDFGPVEKTKGPRSQQRLSRVLRGHPQGSPNFARSAQRLGPATSTPTLRDEVVPLERLYRANEHAAPLPFEAADHVEQMMNPVA